MQEEGRAPLHYRNCLHISLPNSTLAPPRPVLVVLSKVVAAAHHGTD